MHGHAPLPRYTWGDLILYTANITEGHDLNLAKKAQPPIDTMPGGVTRRALKVLVNAIQYNPGYQMRPMGTYHMPHPGSHVASALLAEPLPMWEMNSDSIAQTTDVNGGDAGNEKGSDDEDSTQGQHKLSSEAVADKWWVTMLDVPSCLLQPMITI